MLPTAFSLPLFLFLVLWWVQPIYLAFSINLTPYAVRYFFKMYIGLREKTQQSFIFIPFGFYILNGIWGLAIQLKIILLNRAYYPVYFPLL